MNSRVRKGCLKKVVSVRPREGFSNNHGRTMTIELECGHTIIRDASGHFGKMAQCYECLAKLPYSGQHPAVSQP